ncbi:hypothetical protein DBR06_SOUSAS2310141, partial [Sousa chinensis]
VRGGPAAPQDGVCSWTLSSADPKRYPLLFVPAVSQHGGACSRSEGPWIVLMDDAMDCLMSFSDFLFAFQIQFYYSEFLESVAAIYQDLLSGKNPNTVIVPTSSSGQHRQRPTLGEASMLEGVEASLFYQCLENLCDRHKYSCPPPALVKEVLSNVQRLTFYGFLVALSKHHGINQALGALPDKGDLMHDPALDEELERLLAQIPGLVNSVTAGPEASCLPARTPPRVGSPWRPLHHARKVDAESDGSTEETDECTMLKSLACLQPYGSVGELKGQVIPALSSVCHGVVRSRLHRTSQQHRAKEPGAFGFQRRDKLEAPERAPSASAPTPYPYWWEPRE